MGVCEVRFFDRTNGLAARTKKRIATKRLVVSTNVTSKTPLKIQFWIRNGKNLASGAPRAPAAHMNYFKTSV